MGTFNRVHGKEIKDIGRLLGSDQYEKNYDFNDYEGPCYVEIGGACYVLDPSASAPGNGIAVFEEDDYDMDDVMKYSFKKFYKGVIGDTLDSVDQDADSALHFNLSESAFSLRLNSDDRIGIETD